MSEQEMMGTDEPLVLIVGGDEQGVRALRRTVRAAGYRRMISSEDGVHAVLMAMKWSPSVAVIETSVPGMTAYEVAERLQQLPCGTAVPVVLVTWGCHEIPQMQAEIVGAYGVLESPYEPADLARMMEEALGCAVPA